MRPREGSRARLTLPLDAAMIVAGVALAEVGAARAGVPSTPASVYLSFTLLVLALLALRGMYRSRLTLGLLDEVRGVVASTALAGMIVLSVRALATADVSVAPQSARLWAFATAYLVAGRAVLHVSTLRGRRRGESLRPTLIVGSGWVGQLTARRLLAHPETGLLPVGFIDKDPLPVPDDLPVPILGASWDLEEVVAEHGAECVIVCFSRAPTPVLLRLAERAERLGLQVVFVPRLFERMTRQLEVHHLGGLPLVFAHRPDPRGWRFAVKYAIDTVVSAILVLLTLPLFLTAAVATWLSVGRPIFFRQERIGYDGQRFGMLKFRTMRDGAAQPERDPAPELPPDTAPGGVEGEDRRTVVGAILRRTSIDELPQLLNVLRGDMSLVGPRPERPEFVGLFTESVYRYGERHRVKAGITGWAQVNGLRGKTSVSDRAEWDNYYIENWSLWLDVKILLLTVVAVVTSFRSVE